MYVNHKKKQKEKLKECSEIVWKSFIELLRAFSQKKSLKIWGFWDTSHSLHIIPWFLCLTKKRLEPLTLFMIETFGMLYEYFKIKFFWGNQNFTIPISLLQKIFSKKFCETLDKIFKQNYTQLIYKTKFKCTQKALFSQKF